MTTSDEIRKKWRDQFRKDYHKHHKARLDKITNRDKKRIAYIKHMLGDKCAICGSIEPLVVHHLKYHNGSVEISMKALTNGELALVCRSHHRSIHYISQLKTEGLLEKVLLLLNDKPRNSL